MFLTMLDLNQMYINKTEMSDGKFNIDKKDQELTKKFYNTQQNIQPKIKCKTKSLI